MKVYSKAEELHFEQLVRAELARATGLALDDMRQVVDYIAEHRPRLDWKRIDAQLGQKCYTRMAFSYKHFRDVTRVAYMPQWTALEKKRADALAQRVFDDSARQLAQCSGEAFRAAKSAAIQRVLDFFRDALALKPLKPLNDRIRVRLDNLYKAHMAALQGPGEQPAQRLYHQVSPDASGASPDEGCCSGPDGSRTPFSDTTVAEEDAGVSLSFQMFEGSA